MRLELQMELLKPEIDIDYRRIIISYLKFALEHCEGGRFFEKFYKDRDNIVKDYCFSTVFSKPRFTKEKIYFDKNEMKIIFSCSDRNRTGLIFQTAFLSIQHMEFPLANGNHMILRKIIQKKEVLITEPVVYFQTMLGNGLCVREHNRETNRDIFITCEDKEFPEKAEMIIKNQLQMAGFYKIHENKSIKSRKTYGDECIYAEITDKTENMLYRAKWFRWSDHFMGNVSSSWK